MNDYISREAAIKRMHEWIPETIKPLWKQPIEEFEKILKSPSIPAADVRPVVRGKWKANPHIGYKRLDEDDEPIWEYVTDFICANCGKSSDKRTDFCPNCGADMREVNDGN